MNPETMTAMLVEFHETYGLDWSDQPTENVSPDTVQLRIELITEEFKELVGDHEQEGALETGDLYEIAKECADLIYVVIGTAIAYGINIERVFEEVHRSNMSKLGADGKPVYRESDGKVLKGPNYREADVRAIVDGQGSLRASLRPRRRSLY